MTTEKEKTIATSKVNAFARGVDNKQWILILKLYAGDNTGDIAVVWGKNSDATTIKNLIGDIYELLNKTRLIDERKINSYTRLFITLGLIAS